LKKLAIITTHPIQYNAPLFRLLHERRKIQLKVFYTWEQSQKGQLYDPGFGILRQWDIPLTDGYEYVFVRNTSLEPGSHHFRGIINPTLIREVRSFSPDAILVYGWSFWSHLKLMYFFKGKLPIYFRGDSNLLDESNANPLRSFFRRLFLSRVYRYIDIALFVGKANKQYFLRMGIKENQLRWMPHAIDNNRFSFVSQNEIEKILEWRSRFGFLKTDCVFLFAGKLEPKKNPEILLEAFSGIDNQSAKLIIVGNGILEFKLKMKFRNDKRIHFIDFQNQSQMPLLYRVADVFVLPSSGPGETWGLSVNEAMACGKPIIVSNKCGCAQDLINENGYVFSFEKKNELKKILCSFINNPEKVNTFGEKSKELINNWTIKKAAFYLEDLLCH
jgi:glycosyltransferase involved in cell wall biosynthesis